MVRCGPQRVGVWNDVPASEVVRFGIAPDPIRQSRPVDRVAVVKPSIMRGRQLHGRCGDLSAAVHRHRIVHHQRINRRRPCLCADWSPGVEPHLQRAGKGQRPIDERGADDVQRRAIPFKG